MREKITKYFRQAVAGICMVALAFVPAVGFSQAPLPVPAPADTGQPIPVPAPNQQPVLASNQLDDLVAPLALYPDPLISQVLVAATYPLEVVEAYQWLQQHPGLSGQALTQAAAGQNWDPSVQALVMFPDVLKRLNEDVAWTTNLGNAFLNQQADVMAAIQRLRQSAEQSGKLVSTPQQQVINTTDAGQPVVQIVPANPDVIYVPSYDPAYFWGPPLYYPYPAWYYPPLTAGLFFGAGIGIGAFFGAGWGGWGFWGWHPGWGSRAIFVNHAFVNRFNFNTRVAGLRGTSVWSHDVFHRQGVPYPNRALTQRFAPAARQAGIASPRTAAPMARSYASSPRASAPMASAAPRQSYANRSMTQSFANRNSFASAPRSAGSFSGARSYTAPSRSYAPQARSFAPQARSFAPQARSFAPQARSSAPMARSAAPSFSRGGGGSFSSHGGGSSSSHGGGGGSHGGGGGRARR